MALPLYAGTLFVSAFILFLVQPMIGKMILPRLGGTPQVWNTCMVFFQMVLLAGYAYTHTVSTRLTLRQQLILHAVLLFLPFLVLLPWHEIAETVPFLAFLPNGPFNVASWRPTLGANPLFETLGLLSLVVGLPFLVVSTSAPLLQKWFSSTGHPAAKDPYFLYGASNLGSMLGLWAYPFFIEWMYLLREQAWIWTVGFGVLVVLVLACAALVWIPAVGQRIRLGSAEDRAPAPAVPSSTAITASAAPAAPEATGIKKPGKGPARGPATDRDLDVSVHRQTEEITKWRRLRWVGLAAVPSSLMLGVTTHITTDLSPIPLFWIVPLSLYLLSFILVFMRWPINWIGNPHRYTLYAQPILIALMLLVEWLAVRDHGLVFPSIFFDLCGFFATALVCHGELAKDRPGTQHLTEFYLLMSVGGMVGGMFNGLIAPILFVRVWEFNLAVMAACLLRPVLRDFGWIDQYWASTMSPPAAHAQPAGKGGKAQPRHVVHHAAEPSESLTKTLDFGLAAAVFALAAGLAFFYRRDASASAVFIGFGVPLVIACFFLGRPMRFGLAITGIILVYGMLESSKDPSLFADRSYFGIIRVREGAQPVAIGGTQIGLAYHNLIHGRIDHGMNFLPPDKNEDKGSPSKDFSRIATTYYHRLGPAGRVMELYNWHSQGKANTYHADARMPGYLTALAGGEMGLSTLPLSQFVGLWSEPAYATIGLGTGTMAAYGRPYQHVHYYEIDNHILRLSLPKDVRGLSYFTHETLDNYLGGKQRTFFNYLQQATLRGSEVQVLMGDARLRMALPYKNFHERPQDSGGPDNFYHMMVVDAFSSDAIPVHLITKQAIEMYFKKLTKEGILAVHTSNRYVDLPKVVADVATSLGYSYVRAHDETPGSLRKIGGVDGVDEVGHYTSEWVLVAREGKYLRKVKEPDNYRELVRKSNRDNPRQQMDPNYFSTEAIQTGRHIWTDDHSNLFQVLRRIW